MIYYSPREVTNDPNPGDRVSGGADRLSIHGTEGSGAEAEEDSAGSCQAYEEDDSTASTRGVASSGEAEFSLSSDSPGPLVLQNAPEGRVNSPGD